MLPTEQAVVGVEQITDYLYHFIRAARSEVKKLREEVLTEFKSMIQ